MESYPTVAEEDESAGRLHYEEHALLSDGGYEALASNVEEPEGAIEDLDSDVMGQGEVDVMAAKAQRLGRQA